jgi:hypothetical protein
VLGVRRRRDERNKLSGWPNCYLSLLCLALKEQESGYLCGLPSLCSSVKNKIHEQDLHILKTQSEKAPSLDADGYHCEKQRQVMPISTSSVILDPRIDCVGLTSSPLFLEDLWSSPGTPYLTVSCSSNSWIQLTRLRVIVQCNANRSAMVSVILSNDLCSRKLPESSIVVTTDANQVRRVRRESAVPHPALMTIKHRLTG